MYGGVCVMVCGSSSVWQQQCVVVMVCGSSGMWQQWCVLSLYLCPDSDNGERDNVSLLGFFSVCVCVCVCVKKKGRQVGR